jgi:hypothetical protein
MVTINQVNEAWLESSFPHLRLTISTLKNYLELLNMSGKDRYYTLKRKQLHFRPSISTKAAFRL